jgi:hypothetical protein
MAHRRREPRQASGNVYVCLTKRAEEILTIISKQDMKDEKNAGKVMVIDLRLMLKTHVQKVHGRMLRASPIAWLGSRLKWSEQRICYF